MTLTNLRRLLFVLGFTLVGAATANALNAECIDGPWEDTTLCSACNASGCCYTYWHGDVMVDSWCRPNPT